jgi:mono/diheme cytochrome c family protein
MRHRSATTVSALLIAVIWLASIARADERPPVGSGDPVNGKRIFIVYGCYACHGTTGAGGGIAGPKLAPGPLPFEAARAKLRSSAGRMPAYSAAVLKDSEIADMVAYLQSIPGGKTAAEIPLLNR